MRIAIATAVSMLAWTFGFGAVMGWAFDDYWTGVGYALAVMGALGLMVGTVYGGFLLWEWAL